MKHVTFEQAKWLKQKGFNEECRAFYLDGKLEISRHSIGNYNDVKWVRTWRNSPNDDTISAPEQHQVVEWLRVNHGIWVGVSVLQVFEYKLPISVWHFHFRYEKQGWKIDFPTKERFNSPQEAYSAAFDYIKENNLI